MFRQLVLSVLAILAACGVARALVLGGYGAYTAWEDWARLRPGERAGLASSHARSGTNQDYNHYEDPPGFRTGSEVTTVATLVGPGVITRFWMPHVTANDAFPVRLFFDGEPAPRIDTTSDQLPGGAFSYFGTPLVTTFAGGQVSYEPIPFRDSLRIRTENRSGDSHRHYYQYSYRTLPSGTPLESWSESLAPEIEAARVATATLFATAGAHPAGTSLSAVILSTGPGGIPPGESRELADVAGPGIVRRITLRMDGATDADLDGLQLRLAYDGGEAAVDVPVADFFGAGHGRALYRSLPMGTDSPDGFYCHWPMPFRDHVRITLANGSAFPISVDSTIVEYEAKSFDGGLAYLHARRSESVRQPGQLLHSSLAVTGAGHYVGNFLFVEQDTTDPWILEGDDIAVVDGADTLNGTGLEDAYNGGYYYNRAGDPGPEPEGAAPEAAIRALHGILKVEIDSLAGHLRADQYRWQIADRVSFEESIDVAIECRYGIVGSRWVSVAFWYERPASATGPGRAAPAADAPFQLAQNFPNPVWRETTIPYSLDCPAFVVLEVFDVGGRKVDTVVRGWRGAGSHAERWNAAALPSGVYLYRLRAGFSEEAGRMLILR